MRVRSLTIACAWPLMMQGQRPLTLQQVLSAPYASELTAAPAGRLFAWVEDVEGRHNLWVGGPREPARMLTHNTADDGQDIRQLAWSADGKTIAYTYGAESGVDGKPANPAHLQRPTPVQIMLQPVDEGTSAIVVGEGRNPLFEPLNHHLLFLRAGQIWSADLGATCSSSTGCTLRVDPASVHQLVYDRGSASSLTLSPDSRTLAFISTRRAANAPSHRLLALFDLLTQTLTFPAPSTGNDLAPAFSPDGKQLAWLRAPFTPVREFALDRVSANPWSIQTMDLQTHAVRAVFTPEANKPGSALPKMSTGEPYLLWAPQNRLIFFSEKSGYLHPYITPAQGGEPRDLVGDLPVRSVEVEDPVVSSDGKGLLYASAGAFMNCVGGKCDRYEPLPDASDTRTVWMVALDGDLSATLPVPLTQKNTIGMHPAQLQDGTLAGLISNAEKPFHAVALTPHAVAYMDGVAAPRALREGTPTFDTAILSKPLQVVFDSNGEENIEWPFALNADTNHLHGQLFLPQQEAGPSAAPQDDKVKRVQKHPAILFFHGGPHRQMLLGYPPGEYYSNAYAMNQYLASRGFIVLSVNYRCGSGYGLEFRQCEHAGADGASEYADVLAAQHYLASRPDVDAKRIGVWGGSYGGYLTALALARNSDLFAAGVDIHGVHDWNLEDNASDWKQGTFAEQDAIAAKAFASSPMADVARWRSPVLLIHGDNDAEVAYAETALLADRLRAQQTPVEELIFPDETHNFLLHSDWLKAYEATAAFFERTLKP